VAGADGRQAASADISAGRNPRGGKRMIETSIHASGRRSRVTGSPKRDSVDIAGRQKSRPGVAAIEEGQRRFAGSSSACPGVRDRSAFVRVDLRPRV
jgi:hypothetical protein